MFKLIITTPERRRSTLFIVNFEQIFYLVVVFLFFYFKYVHVGQETIWMFVQNIFFRK